MQFASTTCLQANKKLATHRSQVARCVARPLASTSSSRDEVTGGFAAAAHRDPIAGSISSLGAPFVPAQSPSLTSFFCSPRLCVALPCPPLLPCLDALSLVNGMLPMLQYERAFAWFSVMHVLSTGSFVRTIPPEGSRACGALDDRRWRCSQTILRLMTD